MDGKAKLDELLDGPESVPAQRRRRAAILSIVPGGEVKTG